MRDEAAKDGFMLTITDANNDQSKQIQDIKGLISQRSDALFIAPITEQLANAVRNAGAPRTRCSCSTATSTTRSRSQAATSPP